MLLLIKKLFNSLFFAFLFVFYAYGNIYNVSCTDIDEAFKVGKELRAQFKHLESRDYLKCAADKGHADAAYLLAMDLFHYKKTIRTSSSAQKYLVLSAENGSRHAMRYLYQNDSWLTKQERIFWQQEYLGTLITLAQTNVSQALYELSEYYQPLDSDLADYYLQHAVEFNHPKALMRRAEQYHEGKGGIGLPGSQETKVRETYLRAANMGYIPAIKTYIQLLEEKGRYKDAFKWRMQAIKEGDITSLASVGIILGGYSQVYQSVQPDLVRAKAYLGVYLSVAGTDEFSDLYNRVLDYERQLSQLITAEQTQEVETLEEELKNDLSFYNHDLYWDL